VPLDGFHAWERAVFRHLGDAEPERALAGKAAR
jgi:hypothetical protein